MFDLTPEQRTALVVLAASRGVLSALTSDESLGDAARGFRLASRTAEGDAFEMAFLWARELDDYAKKALRLPTVIVAIREAENASRAKAFEEIALLLDARAERHDLIFKTTGDEISDDYAREARGAAREIRARAKEPS